MKFNLSFSDLIARFKRNATSLFWIVLIVLLVLEVLVLWRSLAIMPGLRGEPPVPFPSRSVRVNFTAYDEAVKIIEAGQEVSSQNPPATVADPFQ